MAGDVRGQDFNSWWQNRAAYRREVSQAAEQWRAAAARFATASGGARPAASAGPPTDTVDELVRLGESSLAALQSARNEFAGVDGERQQAQSNFAAEQNAIQARYAQRVHAEQEAAVQKDYQQKVQLEKSKAAIRKFAAVAIFAVAMYAIVKF